MKISGIYQIQSKIKPERVYIGSAIDVKKRWLNHLIILRKSKHHSVKLQRHFDKYGESDLVFTVITTCEKYELIEKEQFFIDSLKPWFNILPTAGSNLGYKASEETKKKMSAIHKGNKSRLGMTASPETRKKLSESHKGIKHTKEFCEKISKRNLGNTYGRLCKGKIVSLETREKLRVINTGKKLSEEHRKKLHASTIGNKSHTGLTGWNKGMKMSAESCRKNSEAHKGLSVGVKNPMYGKKHSEETRQKIAMKAKGRVVWNKGMKGRYTTVKGNKNKVLNVA